jgi:uncharacterized protein YajQ (UPF0234 family)
MELKVNLDAATVNQYVAQAVLDSAIGDQINQVLQEKISNIGKSWNPDNPLRKVIEAEISNQIQKLIREREYADLIRETIKKQITEELISKITTAAFEAFLDKIGK